MEANLNLTEKDGYYFNENNEACCPYCGSTCVMDYEDLSCDDDKSVEHEIQYIGTCMECGKDF